jgi:hypothetical protein
MHQQIIELLSYALVLTGNHIFTSGAPGTNAAAIRGALRAERPDLLTVVLPQSLSKQPEETQQLLAQVGAELFFLFIITTNNKQTNCLSNFYVPKELKHLIDAVLLDLNLKNPQPLATSAAASTPLLLLLLLLLLLCAPFRVFLCLAARILFLRRRQVDGVVECPFNDGMSLDLASRLCNSDLLSRAEALIAFAFHDSFTVIEATKEAKSLDKQVTVLYLD